MSYTLNDMLARIEDELGSRTDLASQIGLSILTAIAKYEREQFYFSQLRTTAAFTTVAGQEFYTSSDAAFIATLAHIDKISILISGNRYFMEPRTAQYMEDVSINPSVRDQPVDYGYYAEQLRFYPIPDSAYPVNVLYTQRLALTGNFNNAWTNDAEALIRCEAKADIYENVLQEPELASQMRKQINGDPMIPGHRGYLYDLRAETRRRAASPRVRPSYF